MEAKNPTISLTEGNLPARAFAWIKDFVPARGTILELGSGEGTRLLLRMGFRVVSIEHDERWWNRDYGSNHRFIRASIVNGWYCAKQIEKHVSETYNLLIIDGPPGKIGRFGILPHLKLFDPSCDWLVDDTHRRAELALMHTIRCFQGREAIEYNYGKRGFHILHAKK